MRNVPLSCMKDGNLWVEFNADLAKELVALSRELEQRPTEPKPMLPKIELGTRYLRKGPVRVERRYA